VAAACLLATSNYANSEDYWEKKGNLNYFCHFMIIILWQFEGFYHE